MWLVIIGICYLASAIVCGRIQLKRIAKNLTLDREELAERGYLNEPYVSRIDILLAVILTVSPLCGFVAANEILESLGRWLQTPIVRKKAP